MSLGLELKKLRRTGYIPAFPAGGLLASAFPVMLLAVRSENYISLPGSPLSILLDAGWQMMAMLNLLLTVCGACIMYHTEYAENGIQKMKVLPVRAEALFLGKCITAILFFAVTLLLETAALAGCILYWFPNSELDLTELAENAGYSLVLMLPSILLMLVIASACRNMWVSLGIGVILVFTASMLPQDSFLLSLCPFATPYQMLHTAADSSRVIQYLCVSGIETIVFGTIEWICIKIRRDLA